MIKTFFQLFMTCLPYLMIAMHTAVWPKHVTNWYILVQILKYLSDPCWLCNDCLVFNNFRARKKDNSDMKTCISQVQRLTMNISSKNTCCPMNLLNNILYINVHSHVLWIRMSDSWSLIYKTWMFLWTYKLLLNDLHSYYIKRLENFLISFGKIAPLSREIAQIARWR